MDEDLNGLINRLLEEVQTSTYPSEKLAIRDRYRDTSFLISKNFRENLRGSYLSFGSRRSSLVSSYGNTPTFIRRSFSSNGMLEYAVEQIGSLRWKGSRGLPAVTKEEKENEEIIEDDNGGRDEGINVEIKKEKSIKPNITDRGSTLLPNVGVKPKFLDIQNYDSQHLKIDLIGDEDEQDYISDLQNRKSFLHYDMPLTRKPLIPCIEETYEEEPTSQSLKSQFLRSEFENIKSIDNSFDEDEQEKSYPDKSGNIKIIPPSETGLVKTIQNNNSSLDDLTTKKTNFFAEESILPIITNVNAGTSNSSLFILKDSDSISNIVKSEKLNRKPVPVTVPPAISSSEEENGSLFDRKSVQRHSLKDLPLRSPTPPKRSPRKTSKIFRDKTHNKLNSNTVNSNGISINSGSVNSNGFETVEYGNESNTQISFPPSITKSQPEKDFIKTDHLELKNCGDDPCNKTSANEKSFSRSQRVGIQNLVVDGQVNKSFLVVHPTSESNSLGLAPLSSTTVKVSSKHTSSFPTFQTTKSPSGERQRSLSHQFHTMSFTKPKNRKLSDTISSSYIPSRSSETSHVKLLKFSRSFDDTLPSNPPMLSNFLLSKCRINSVPYEHSLKNYGSNYDLSGSFVNTDSSRLCILM